MNNTTEESKNETTPRQHRFADPLAEAVLVRTINLHKATGKYHMNYENIPKFAFNNPFTRKSISNLYYCDMAGPFSLIYFERSDGEDPYPPMFCQPTDNDEAVTSDEIKTIHTEFLKNNNIITLACRRKEKRTDESRVTPSGELKYYFIYFCKSDKTAKDRENVQMCLENLAAVSFYEFIIFLHYFSQHSHTEIVCK